MNIPISARMQTEDRIQAVLKHAELNPDFDTLPIRLIYFQFTRLKRISFLLQKELNRLYSSIGGEK